MPMTKVSGKLGLNLQASLLLYNAPPLCSYFTLFWLFFLQGRYTVYQPTVSETGTEYPNGQVMMGFMLLVGSVSYIAMSVTNCYIETFIGVNRFVRAVLWICCYCTAFGTFGIGVHPMSTNHTGHFRSAVISFGGTFVAELFIIVLLAKRSPWFRTFRRMVYLIIQTIGMRFMIGSWLPVRKYATLTTLGEYAVMFDMGFFYATLWKELSGVDFVMTIN